MTDKTKAFTLLTLSFMFFIIYLLIPPKNPLSPLANNLLFNKTSDQYKVLGFLPYWNLDKLTSNATENITDLAYFSLVLEKNGLSPENSKESRLFQKFLSQKHSKPLHLTISQTDKETINHHLSTSSNRKSLIQDILLLTTQNNLSGIIVDLEPSGGISPTLQKNFTLFIKDLKTSLNNSSTPPTLQIAIYPTAARTQRLWDIQNLSPFIDYFIVMTYDYHRASTSTSGPNAPLRGSSLNFQEDILKNISEITKLTSSKKLLLGIPFYGYEWETSDAQKYSPTLQGYTASIERIEKLIQEKNLTPIWDKNSLTPYLVHEDQGETKQIYFDNSRSISLKLDLVKQADLAGIAIWALGYEGNNPSLWQTISTLNSR